MGIETNTDIELLTMLDLRDHEGMSGSGIAERMGRSKNSVVGAMNRIDKAMVGDSGVGNGTMPRKWWKK